MILTIIIGILSIILMIVFSCLLGLYIQNKFNILKDNFYISYGIGFLVYIAIISIIFIPIIIFALSGTVLFIVWWIINVSFFTLLIYERKHIKIKDIKIKRILILIISIIMISTITRYMGSLPKAQDNIFYIPWVKNNQYIDHLNRGLNITAPYWAEGWYYFQTVLLRSTHMDQNFMNLWVFGFLTNSLLVSSMLGIVYTITKKDNIYFMIFSLCFGVAIGWFINGSTYSNIGSTTLIWTIVLLFILAINFLKSENPIFIYLICIIGYAGWAISSSALFIFAIFYIGIIFVLLFKKSRYLLKFSLINGSLIFLMILMFAYKMSTIYFILSFIFFIVAVSLTVLLLCFFQKWTYKFSLKLFKYRYWILFISWGVVVILSICFWFIHGKDPWLNFSYRGDGITPYWPNDPWLAFDAFRYVLYWIFVIYLIFNLIINIKKGIKNDSLNFMLLIVFFSMMFFYNPIVASLWNGKIIPTIVFHRVRLDFMIPMYISMIIIMNKIKLKYIKRIIYVIIPMSLTSAITVPLFTQNMMKNVYSVYTGYGKGLPEVAEYINSKPELKDKKIAGDINGINAYINNPMSFDRYTPMFDKMEYTFLTNTLYSKISTKNQDAIQILIKVKLNVSKDFNSNHNWFSKRISFNQYYLYLKNSKAFK